MFLKGGNRGEGPRVYPQRSSRLGTRYEKSLKRRFEKADQVFSEIYLRKARLDKKGLRAYTAVEFRQDLYATAFGHDLCAEALMAYFKVLHRREILRIFSEVRAKEERGINGHSGEKTPERSFEGPCWV